MGFGVYEDMDEGLRLLREAAERGSALAAVAVFELEDYEDEELREEDAETLRRAGEAGLGDGFLL